MNLTSRLLALGVAVCAAAPAAESLTLTVEGDPLELAVSELLERYARPNHLQLRVDPRVAKVPLKLLETCTLDRGALSALLRGHGVSLISAGPRLYAGAAAESNPWPAIPSLLAPGVEAEFPTELVTRVLPLSDGDDLGRALLQVHGADQHRDVTLTWIGERLVLTGPAERVDYYLDLGRSLSPSAPPLAVHSVTLAHANAREVGAHLSAMLVTAKGEPPAFSPRPSITADPRTNTLLLRGPGAWLEQARGVIQRLDVRVSDPAGPSPTPVDLTLYVVDAAQWRALSAGQRPGAVAAALERAEDAIRLWGVERWLVTERDTVLQDQAHGRSEGLGLASLHLETRRSPQGLALELGLVLAEGGEPTRSLQAHAVLSLADGPGILARNLGPERVVVLVAR